VAYLILGIVCLLLAALIPLPYILYVLLLIVGIVALIAGLYFLFIGASHAPADGARRYRRW
jgi:hypothetical protein